MIEVYFFRRNSKTHLPPGKILSCQFLLLLSEKVHVRFSLVSTDALRESVLILVSLQELNCKITRLKTRLKITQLEKVRFIKVNEFKLTQVELF